MALKITIIQGGAAVTNYSGTDEYVVIPETYLGKPVTKIEEGVFKSNPHLKAVFIPKTITTIGIGAFEQCVHLQYIGCGLGDNDKALSDIPALPAEAQPTPATLSAKDLPDLSILPPSVRIIGARAFLGTALKFINIQGTYIYIGNSAFEGCNHLEVAALYSCKHLIMGKRVFMNSKINRFYAPLAEHSTLDDYAFAFCGNLISAQIPARIVGERCFFRCHKLVRTGIPKFVDRIGSEAFAGCKQLDSIPKAAPTAPPSSRQSPLSSPKNTTLESDDEPDDFPFDLDLPVFGEEDEEEPIIAPPCAQLPQASTDVLFQMRIDFGTHAKTHIPSLIKGIFTKTGKKVFFQVQVPVALNLCNFQCIPDQGLSSITPVIDYIIKKEKPIVLMGKQNNQYYTVSQILPSGANAMGNSASFGIYHEMIRRLKKPIPEGFALGERSAPQYIRGSAELDAFISICKDRLPSWMLKAYYRNKDLAQQVGITSSDARKHAAFAQELLANIDWLPDVMNMPTVEQARKILEKAFFGLNDVKEQLLEIVAQIRRTGTLPKWGILLTGPAGTGKTTIAKVTANMMGMPLIQVDMSSVGKDPEAICGSSRVFSNAQPGQILTNMYVHRTSSAVLLVNEADKATTVANTLLSILDKTGFYENFLEEIVPTDNLFCIATCNDLSKLSKPLLDRFLVIDIPAYTQEEKRVIWTDHALPAAKDKPNINAAELSMTAEAIDLLIDEYAIEPGARDLEQYAERFLRNYCKHTDGSEEAQTKKVYTAEDIQNILGPSKKVTRSFGIRPGEINAAFYHDGRAHFFLIQVSVISGTGKFETLGPMGSMQADFCKVAYLCARNTVNSASCDLSKYDVSVFVPQPIPESMNNHVGLACYAAICSKLLNTNLALNDICFVGGCDVNGSLYFDESDLTPLLRSMKAQGVSTLYAPMGTSKLVSPKTSADCNVTIIEAPDAKTLFSLAVTRNNLDGYR